MEIVETMHKLGFNFWQVVAVFLVIFLRKEVRGVFSRISSLKIGENEITLSKGGQSVQDLIEIRSELEKEGSEAVGRKIEERIEHKVLGAFINIRKNTSYFWTDLVKRQANTFESPIREQTFNRISADLDILVSAKLIRYARHAEENYYNSLDNDPIFKLIVHVLDENIDSYIKEAQKY